MADEGEPGRTRGAGVAWSIVFGEDSTNHIFVDLHAEGVRDLLGDAHIAKLGIAGL